MIGRTLNTCNAEHVVSISFDCVHVCLCVLSCDQLFVTHGPRQAPPSMEFSRQEYWSGLLFPSLGDRPDPGIEPVSPILAGRFFTTMPPGKPIFI